jgi:hypothetical protein
MPNTVPQTLHLTDLLNHALGLHTRLFQDAPEAAELSLIAMDPWQYLVDEIRRVSTVSFHEPVLKDIVICQALLMHVDPGAEPLQAEIARLDELGYTSRWCDELRSRFPEHADELGIRAEATDPNSGCVNDDPPLTNEQFRGKLVSGKLVKWAEAFKAGDAASITGHFATSDFTKMRSAAEIAFCCFWIACEAIGISPFDRGSVSKAHDWLLQKGLPAGVGKPAWFWSGGLKTFANYVSKIRRQLGLGVYAKGRLCESRSIAGSGTE